MFDALFYLETAAQCCSSTWTADRWMDASVTLLLRNSLVPRWDAVLLCEMVSVWSSVCFLILFICHVALFPTQLSALKAEDLAAMLACNRSSNSSSSRPTWKLLLSKASHVLNEALDLLTNRVRISNTPHITFSWSDRDLDVFSLQTLDPRNPAVSMVLDAIREIRLDMFGIASINNPALIQLWFNHRLRPFLPAVSPDFLSCLTTKGLNCTTYQHMWAHTFPATNPPSFLPFCQDIAANLTTPHLFSELSVQILSRLQPHMTMSRQMSVYTHFIKVFLTRNNTAGEFSHFHRDGKSQSKLTQVRKDVTFGLILAPCKDHVGNLKQLHQPHLEREGRWPVVTWF